MPKISLTSSELPYGIVSDEVFWVANGILDKEAIRESRDEELVLDILLDMVLDPIPVSGSAYRNSAYGRDDNATTAAGVVDARIISVGPERIEQDFLSALDVIKQTISEAGHPWATWVITQQNPRGIPRYFHAVFIAIHELLADHGMELNDLRGLTRELRNFWDRDLNIPAGGGNWGANRKRPLIDAVKTTLQPYFVMSDDPILVRSRETATHFEIEMQMAITEHSLFELKQGFTKLDGSREFDEGAFERVLKTASAMANHQRGAKGFIFFGVADRPEHARRIEEMYGVQAFEVGDFEVVGTQHELTALGVNRDQHMQRLVNKIRSSKLEAPFAAELARSLTVFDYRGYLIWSLRPCGGDSPTSWDGRFFVREGNSTIELRGQEVVGLIRRFAG